MTKSSNPWESAWPTGLSEAIEALEDFTPATVPIKFTERTAVLGVSPSDRAYVSRVLTGARMRVSAAPAGSALTALVQHHNGTSWVTIGTLTIADGSTTGASITFSQDQLAGQLLRINYTAVGSGTPAAGVAIDVLWDTY